MTPGEGGKEFQGLKEPKGMFVFSIGLGGSWEKVPEECLLSVVPSRGPVCDGERQQN